MIWVAGLVASTVARITIARFSPSPGGIVNRLTIVGWEGDLRGVPPSMTHEQALAIVEAASIYGISLGIHDDWTDYLKARAVLGDPIDLRPIRVCSNLVPTTHLYGWEREVLLPVVRPLLLQWVEQQVEEVTGGSQ